MRIRLSNTNFHTLLLLLLFAMPAVIGNAGMVLFDFSVVAVYAFHRRIGILKNCSALLVPVLLAFLVGLFRHLGLYPALKDVFYLITPVITLLLGEILARRLSPSELFIIFLRIGLVLSVVNIVILLYKFGFSVLLSPREIRDLEDSYPSVNAVALLSFFISFYSILYRLNLPYKYVYFFVSFLAIYLAGSRSYWVVVMLYSLGISLPLYIKNKALFFSILSVAAVFVVLIFVMNPDSKLINMFLSSATEMKIEDYMSMADVNKNYRGYEAFCAIHDYSQLPLVNKVIGGGCGQLVDLGEFSPFEFSQIPILHNGYPYFLIKIGVLGFMIFLSFFAWCFCKIAKKMHGLMSHGHLRRQYVLLSLCTIVALWIMHSSVNAIFNYAYVLPLMVVSATLYYIRTDRI